MINDNKIKNMNDNAAEIAAAPDCYYRPRINGFNYEDITLKDFIKKFICPNSLIRLWYKDPDGSGHIMLVEHDKDVCMEWQILRGECWQAKYENNIVVGVTDILVDGAYKEAINIVIDKHMGVIRIDKNDPM